MDKSTQVWINSSSKTFGPYSISQVEEYLTQGNFSRNDFYCEVDGKEWVSLGKLFPVKSIKNDPQAVQIKQPLPPIKKVATTKNQDSVTSQINDYDLYFRKSWTAYIVPGILFLVFIIPVITIPLVIIPLIWTLSIRKYKLYTNESGVWISYGLFPWTKGFSGVKWRDVNECTLVNNFLSWILGSYTVVVSHRYTKTDEIIMTHTRFGKKAVFEINGLHQKYLGMNTDNQMLQEG